MLTSHRLTADQSYSKKDQGKPYTAYYGCKVMARNRSMIQDWAQRIKDMNDGLKDQCMGAPEATRSFSALAQGEPVAAQRWTRKPRS